MHISLNMKMMKSTVNTYKSVGNRSHKNHYLAGQVQKMIRINSKKTLLVAIAILAWFGLILQLYILIDNTPGNGLTPLQALGRFFIFFTILTNLLVAVDVTIFLFASHSRVGHFFSKASTCAAVALYIFMVGLVYNVVLGNIWHPQGTQRIADELLHVVVPATFIFYWLLFAAKSPLRWFNALQWLVYPAIYFVYAMIRGSIEGFYAYPFLDADKLSAGKIILNCAGLLTVFIIVGLLFIAIGKKMSRRSK